MLEITTAVYSAPQSSSFSCVPYQLCDAPFGSLQRNMWSSICSSLFMTNAFSPDGYLFACSTNKTGRKRSPENKLWTNRNVCTFRRSHPPSAKGNFRGADYLTAASCVCCCVSVLRDSIGPGVMCCGTSKMLPFLRRVRESDKNKRQTTQVQAQAELAGLLHPLYFYFNFYLTLNVIGANSTQPLVYFPEFITAFHSFCCTHCCAY